jgi:type I restriction enzyme S subunit
MRKYQSYKPSGVEWIGEIPVSWNTTKLKYFLDEIITGGTPDTSNEEYWIDNGINWISISDITSSPDGILETKKTISEEGRKSKNLKVLEPNSLIYSIYGSIGKVNRIKVSSTIHQGILSFITNKKLNNYYLEKYLIFLQPFISSFSSSNTQDNLNQDKIKNLYIQVPPLQEQEQIVKYLDEKTSIIDKLISTKQRKVELLKEQRTTLINQVINKGLNPNVKMKYSGVEWIGEIPEEWIVGKLKNFSELRISSVDKHIYEYERQVIVCNYTDVYYNEFITNELELRKGSCSEEEYYKFKLDKGDVIITKDSESPTDIGVPSLVNDDFENVVCGYHLSIIKPSKNKLVGGFLFRQLQTKRIRSYYEVSSNGITRFGLGKSSVLDTPLIIPPIQEQQEIVDYLNKHTKEIDDLVSMEQNKIELLKEYRQSLISEVITGKIKVV